MIQQSTIYQSIKLTILPMIQKICQDKGGSLASIRSSEEHSWIVDTFLPPVNSSKNLCSIKTLLLNKSQCSKMKSLNFKLTCLSNLSFFAVRLCRAPFLRSNFHKIETYHRALRLFLWLVKRYVATSFKTYFNWIAQVCTHYTLCRVLLFIAL